MTWGRGFFRVWLVFAVAWMLVSGWIAINPSTDEFGRFSDLVPLQWSRILANWQAIVLPPLGILFIGFVIKWLILGFVRSDR